MKNLRFISRYYSTPINIYNFNKNKAKKVVKHKQHKNNYSSYKNMYNALKKNSKLKSL